MNAKRVFPFRLITFDVTNTLLKFTANIGKTYGDIGRKYGVKCDTNELTDSFKHQFKKMSEENPHFGYDTGLSWQNWWRRVVFDTFRRCHNDIADSKLDLISQDLIEIYKTEFCWKPASGALELLNYLQDRGVTLGVISNSDPRLHDILCNVKMDSYFKFILTSHEVGYSKPDKRIFDRAMKESMLEDLKKRQCLHIGDNLEFDYEGAKRHGWNSFLITKKKLSKFSNQAELEDKVFVDLISLKEYMRAEWNEYEVPKHSP
ncbi:rhythmically expressed gene 2 protein-like [Coccinella septempunctata]|uniref:rhythmically expressed gene 2 protein-like n=1 Tax=Coccinella septempunctata TaxID=41139 RepID=UPI001D09159E|nr:rhythmically expressed gene 2 protein-like [Coccinella septempunctata]